MLFLSLCYSLDCNEAEEIELWGICYNIETTTSISLSGTPDGLTGGIPWEISLLVNLNYLNLSYNELSGPIPPEIGELINLTTLYLHGNQLTGPIPSEIGGLENLTRLYLQHNQLTGFIPTEIGELANLSWLYLGDNQLTGSIPEEIGELTNLRRFNLEYSQLSGAIPESLYNLSLSIFDIENNYFTGFLSDQICDIPNLTIRNNEFCPPYPECVTTLRNITTYDGWDELKNVEFDFCYGDESISDVLNGNTTIKLGDYYGDNAIYTPRVFVVEMSTTW